MSDLRNRVEEGLAAKRAEELRARAPAVVDEAHVERRRAPRDGRADPPRAYDPEGRPRELEADEERRRPAAEPSLADEAIGGDDAAGGGEEERERELGVGVG